MNLQTTKELIAAHLNTTAASILILDIDGTVTTTISGADFKQHPKDVKLLPGAKEAIAHFKSQGWEIVGASNQGGIASGHKTLASTFAEMQFTLELIPEISSIYFCPDFQGKECWQVTPVGADEVGWSAKEFVGMYRKPQAGMLQLIHLDSCDDETEVEQMLMVGDRDEDRMCAEAVECLGCKFMWAQDWRETFER